MLSRRDMLFTLGGAATASILGRVNPSIAQSSTFSDLLKRIVASPDLMFAAGKVREGSMTQFDAAIIKGIAPRLKPSQTKISDDATSLIIDCEVSSPSVYQLRYTKPVWPKGHSGLTIGVGYDVGWVTAPWLREDWDGILTEEQINLLAKACGVHGQAAGQIKPSFQSVQISWEQAKQQFATTGLPRYVAETLNIHPNVAKLSPDSLGALVSLDYNRGQNFQTPGDRYEEMREIRYWIVKEKFDAIPPLIRHMERLWAQDKDLHGVVLRREAEAALFEKGLSKN